MSFNAVLRRLAALLPRNRSGQEATFRSMVEQSGDVICHLVNERFTYVSPSAASVFGWDASAMIGTDGAHLVYEPDLPVLEDVLARQRRGEAVGAIRHQLRVICGDGSLKWSETSARSERSRRQGTQTILIIRDISERKIMEEQLEALALTDGLTGLANRRSFDEALERSWRITLRQGGEMALLLVDIDHFKQFNDSYGHQAGDDCLRTVAQVLSRFAQRPADRACRYGGEEFAIILGDIGPDAAFKLAEEIRGAVAALGVPHQADPSVGHITVSIGVATAVARVGGSVRMPETLLQAADHALYMAKAGGRDRVERTVLIAPAGS